jgi:hypothetical protein
MRPVTGTPVIRSLRDLARVASRARGRCRGRLQSQRRNGPHPPPWQRSESRPPSDSPARDPSMSAGSSRVWTARTGQAHRIRSPPRPPPLQAPKHLRSRHESPRRVRRPIPSQLRRGMPVAREDRLVVPDGLATTIKTTRSATWRCPLAGADGRRPAGRCCDLSIYRACRRDAPRDLLLPIGASG